MSERRMRVAIIGPVPPFRGGIAQHTARLREALSEVGEVSVFSFSRLYPRAIFPGKSDRDPALDGYCEPGTSYDLDSVWPPSWRRVARALESLRPYILVVPWWTVFLAPCFRYVARRARRAGIPVVLMCHNVVEHESSWWRRAVTLRVFRAADGFVTHSIHDQRSLLAMMPHARVAVQPHPIYDQFPPATGSLSREAATELLFFGFVRPYKGLDVLIEAMALIRDLDIRLTVAGEIWGDPALYTDRVDALGVRDRVRFVDRYLGAEETAEYFELADWIVLPYRSATGSGVVPLAYHYNRPVIVTRVGGLPDVVRDGETGVIAEPESPAALADAIRRAVERGPAAMSDGISRIKAELSWDELARAVLSVGRPQGSGNDREPTGA